MRKKYTINNLKIFKISFYFPFALRVKYDNYEIQFV